MSKLSSNKRFDLLMGVSGVLIVLTGIIIERNTDMQYASTVALAISIIFIIVATTIYRQKHADKSSQK